MEYSSSIWWWKDPNNLWIVKVLDYIKTSVPHNKDIILLHCEDVTSFERSIPLTNYFFNVLSNLTSCGEKHTMYLSVKDVIACIELHLGRRKKKDGVSETGILQEEIIEFYDKYIMSFEENNEDKSIAAFKEFLKQNNCLDLRLLLDSCLKFEKDNINKHIMNNIFLILGTPTSIFIKQFINILADNNMCSISVETPLDVSFHGSPSNKDSERIKVVSECTDIKDMVIISEPQLSVIGSATEEYAQDLFLSFLSLLVNSRNELALSKALTSPVINLSHEAFTALKHLSIEKEMPMCQVAISYVTRIRLGGKGYAPPKDCPMLRHLKGFELFLDILNQMQTIIEEDPCPKSAIRRLINILKKKLLKCSSEKLKDSSIEAVVENLQSTYTSVFGILKSRVFSSAAQICQETMDILYQFINFLNCNDVIYNPEEVLAKKHYKRTPLNLPPLLGYFRSPDEESSCDTKSNLNEDSCFSRNSISYFHHSESSEVTASCVNSSTPSKLTFNGCLKENDENSQKQIKEEMFENAILKKKNRKRAILGEITNENNCSRDDCDSSVKKTVKVNSGKQDKKKAGTEKKSRKKEPNRSKKFKQIEGQVKITNFFQQK